MAADGFEFLPLPALLLALALLVLNLVVQQDSFGTQV